MPCPILAATTDATQSSSFTVRAKDVPVHVTCPGLAGAETATLQFQDSAGNWHDYYDEDALLTMTATQSGRNIYGPGIYRVDKDATVGAVLVDIGTAQRP